MALLDLLFGLQSPMRQTTPPFLPGGMAAPAASKPAPVLSDLRHLLTDEDRERSRQDIARQKAEHPELFRVPGLPLDEEGARLQAGLQAMGAFDMAGRGTAAQAEAHGIPNQKVAAQEVGILSRLGRGALDYLSDPINRKQLAIGLNSMRLNPDANLARSLQSQIETEQGMRLLRSQGNKTADALQDRADKIMKSDPQKAAQLLTAADFIRNNPTNTEGISAAAKLLFDSSSGFAPTVSGVQTDPVTGEQYVVITDRDTMQPKRMTVGGASQLTPAQEAELETQNAIRLQDIKFAQETGQAAMGRAEQLNESIEKYYLALDALDQGAKSGLFQSRIAAFDAATAQLRSVANQLGIDVVNSATFGALSESELRLALSTSLDLNLPEPELRKQLEAQIRAKDKLRAELIKMAQDLTSGVGYSDYIKKYQFVPLAPPEGVPIGLWRAATPAEKRELTAAAQQ